MVHLHNSTSSVFGISQQTQSVFFCWLLFSLIPPTVHNYLTFDPVHSTFRSSFLSPPFAINPFIFSFFVAPVVVVVVCLFVVDSNRKKNVKKYIHFVYTTAPESKRCCNKQRIKLRERAREN